METIRGEARNRPRGGGAPRIVPGNARWRLEASLCNPRRRWWWHTCSRAMFFLQWSSLYCLASVLELRTCSIALCNGVDSDIVAGRFKAFDYTYKEGRL